MIIPHSACSVLVCVAVCPNGDFAWLYHFPLNPVCPVFLDKRSKSSGFFMVHKNRDIFPGSSHCDLLHHVESVGFSPISGCRRTFCDQ